MEGYYVECPDCHKEYYIHKSLYEVAVSNSEQKSTPSPCQCPGSAMKSLKPMESMHSVSPQP